MWGGMEKEKGLALVRPARRVLQVKFAAGVDIIDVLLSQPEPRLKSQEKYCVGIE